MAEEIWVSTSWICGSCKSVVVELRLLLPLELAQKVNSQIITKRERHLSDIREHIEKSILPIHCDQVMILYDAKPYYGL